MHPSTLDISKKIREIKQTLVLEYLPVGFYEVNTKPPETFSFKKAGSGCIMPLILTSALGITLPISRLSFTPLIT